MKTTRKKKAPISGGARLMAAGYKPVILGLTPDQHEKIQAAALADNRKMTQFLVHHGIRAAEKILGNS